MVLDYDMHFSTVNRGTTGVDLSPSLDIYGNPWFQKREQVETSTGTYKWLPIGLGVGWKAICGDSNGTTLSMERSTDSGSPYGYVLKATGATSGVTNCSVRFKGNMEAMNSTGHLSAVMLMKGNFDKSYMGYAGTSPAIYSSEVLHGTQSTTSYALFAGSESAGHALVPDHIPYIEVQVAPGQTLRIANVILSRGTVTTAQPATYPYNREAFSLTGIPTEGSWSKGEIIWNKAHSNYLSGSTRGFTGLPMGWFVEDNGTFGGTDPNIHPFGQLGIDNTEHVTSGSPAQTSNQQGEIYFTHTSGSPTVANTDFWMAYGNNTNEWKRINTGYTLQLGCKGEAAVPIASATYYIAGGFAEGLLGTSGNAAVYIPKSGTIKTAYVSFHNSGTKTDTATSTIYVRVNSSDTSISSSVINNASQTYVSNTGLSIAVAQGDTLQLKWVTPAWVTPPTQVYINATIYIE
jgi:hypothetical protein